MRLRLALAAALLVAAAGARAESLPGAPPFPDELAAQLGAREAQLGDAHEPRTHHTLPDGRPRFRNRLLLEQSPYLLQHAHNPVNWYAWGDEAFREARRRGVPVFLSIGYSTCHWCHVMERESFEDLEIAEFLNRHFVSVKVDREERPDVDAVYMAAVQAANRGRGGWPMTLFLTHDRAPFFAGTYFPPRDGPRGSRSGFLTIARRLRELYASQPESVLRTTRTLTAEVAAALAPEPSVGLPGTTEIEQAYERTRSRYDAVNGGVRSRTKFPSSLPIDFLLRVHRRTADARALEMARSTLDAMRRGGIYDHVGGGFHRYTTEPTWTVPHFEKMLYDNAQLVVTYTDAFRATGDKSHEDVVRDVLDYVARDMTSEIGTFYSATDADSSGREGIYFVWSEAELRAIAGAELADMAVEAYGATRLGNFEEHTNVLRRDPTIAELAAARNLGEDAVRVQLADIRGRLRARRALREAPLLDTKQLVGWNGLMISGFAHAGATFADPNLVARGARAAESLLARARPGGRLARYLKNGEPYGRGILDDYAFLVRGLLDLFEATGELRWLGEALALQKVQDRDFFDDQQGGYWATPHDGETLLVREKTIGDSAIPSGNSVSIVNLTRLYLLTTDEAYREQAEMTLRAFDEVYRRGATGAMLSALDWALDVPKEILIVAPETREQAEPFLRELAGAYLPNRVVVRCTEDELEALQRLVPWAERKRSIGGETTAYVCENRVCDLPARDLDTFRSQIRAKARPYPTGSNAKP